MQKKPDYMDRPYIICHMLTSLDGKVTGDFLGKTANKELIEEYYKIHRSYGADGFLCGRVTMEGSFLQPSVTSTAYSGEVIEREDYVAEKAKFYAVAVDPNGKLWWNDRVISDHDPGYDDSHIIEIITERVTNAFLAHLRERGVSYIFCGEREINLALAAQKLKNLFGINKLLVEGGGIVNGSFLQEDLIDEISLVLVPEIEFSEKAVSLFQPSKYLSENQWTTSFQLKEVQQIGTGVCITYIK